MKPLSYYRRQLGQILRWLVYEFPKAPRFELYAMRWNTMNRSALGANEFAASTALYDQPSLPRIIWMYWDSGEAGMPFVVRCCVDSWRRLNPDWELRILDAETVSDYADMSDFPKIELQPRFYANLLRLRLLRDHGGVWADATVYCHRPLDAWLNLHMMSGFFALKNPGPDRIASSWFLASTPGHGLPSLWETAYSRYLQSLRHQPHKYFMFHYSFQWALKQRPHMQAAWDEVATFPAVPTLILMEVLEGKVEDRLLPPLIDAGLPISKLSWKTDLSEEAFEARMAALTST